jgi:hypothetical protein
VRRDVSLPWRTCAAVSDLLHARPVRADPSAPVRPGSHRDVTHVNGAPSDCDLKHKDVQKITVFWSSGV